MKTIKFYDSVLVTGPKTKLETSDKVAFIDNLLNRKQALEVFVRATHSARITRNNGLYLPNKMVKATPTLYGRDSGGEAAFNKPVLVNHDTERDPVGRVVAAAYQDMSKSYTYSTDTVLPRHIASTIDKLVNADRRWIALDTIDELMRTGLLLDKKFQGLGFIRAKFQITDAEAIEKVLDGRYQTVSTRMSSNSAVCSVCKEDWADSGICEHTPGEMIDGVPCFLIAGDMEYDEVSWATIPADGEAVKEAAQLVTIDSKDTVVESSNIKRTSAIHLSFRDTEDSTPVVELDDEDSFTAEDMLIDWAWLDSELDLEMGDAKLSAEARKNLSSKTFCGPGKSFPVPDCAHVVSARRLIGRYKGSGDKSTILACVARKAKSLGCDGEDSMRLTNDCGCADTVARMLVKGTAKFEDVLDGETPYELSVLIQLHDRLHMEWDWVLRSDAEQSSHMPVDVYKVHAKLHELVVAKDARGSIVNGKLDAYSAAGEETGEFMLSEYADSMKEQNLVTALDKAEVADIEALVAKLQAETEKRKKVVTTDELQAQLVESTKQLDWLRKEATAQRERLTELDAMENSNKTVLAADAVKLATFLDKLSPEKAEELTVEFATKDVGAIVDYLTTLHACVLSVTINSVGAESTDSKSTETKVVDDPTLQGEQAKTPTPDKWETIVIQRYKEIADTEGEPAAKKYLVGMKQRRVINKDFDVSVYLK